HWTIYGITFAIMQSQKYLRCGNLVFITPEDYNDLPEHIRKSGDPYFIVMKLAHEEVSRRLRFQHSLFTVTSVLVMQARPELIRDKTILDLGTGEGTLAFVAAKLGARKVIGIDIDYYVDWIKIAKENLSYNNFTNIEFVKKDFDDIKRGNFEDVDTAIADLEVETIFPEGLKLNRHIDLLNRLPGISTYIACGIWDSVLDRVQNKNAADKVRTSLEKEGYEFDESSSPRFNWLVGGGATNFIIKQKRESSKSTKINLFTKIKSNLVQV
ncbi:unnamed protein product, partial [marine sediment metagenome]